jgi:hypothetical protein
LWIYFEDLNLLPNAEIGREAPFLDYFALGVNNCFPKSLKSPMSFWASGPASQSENF